MASADGMRFVIPVSTINAACNPRYFGRHRGSTLYSWMAGTYTVFAHKLIPGTQRDSLRPRRAAGQPDRHPAQDGLH